MGFKGRFTWEFWAQQIDRAIDNKIRRVWKFTSAFANLALDPSAFQALRKLSSPALALRQYLHPCWRDGSHLTLDVTKLPTFRQGLSAAEYLSLNFGPAAILQSNSKCS